MILAATISGWNLICDANNPEGLREMRSMKSRPANKGFTILVESDARLNLHVDEVPSLAWDIIDTTQDPVILVLPNGRKVAKESLADDGSIAIRMVSEQAERKLVQMVNGPVACTALTDDKGDPVVDIELADPDVLMKIDYLLLLQADFPKDNQRQIPIIKLGLNGAVEIIRP